MRPDDHQRGFALLIVLWSLALASLLVLNLSSGSRNDVALARNTRAVALARATADGAIDQAIFQILSGSATPVRASFSAAVPERLDVSIRDEGGRVNPNVVGAPLLRALLIGLGLDDTGAASLADAIVDWRSPGTAPSPHGAKAAEYRAAGRTYGPAGQPFRDIADMIGVLGMTPETLAALAPHLTLFWDSDPDPLLADGVVRQAIFRTGRTEVNSGSRAGPRVVTITAVATGAATVARHAVVRFGYSPDGRGWRVLEWDGGEG